MRNQNFKTKEEYLQYRKEWKAEYKQLSENIRLLKFAIRLGQRKKSGGKELNKYEEDIIEQAIKIAKPHIRQWGNDFWLWYLITTRETLSVTATCMLGELKASKEEAQRQYIEQKNSLVTV